MSKDRVKELSKLWPDREAAGRLEEYQTELYVFIDQSIPQAWIEWLDEAETYAERQRRIDKLEVELREFLAQVVRPTFVDHLATEFSKICGRIYVLDKNLCEVRQELGVV